MADCPNCGYRCSGRIDVCPDCHFDFRVWRVVRPEERSPALKRQREIENEKRRIAQEERDKAFAASARYEYRTVYLQDSYNGMLSQSTLENTLTKYANDGWRLHSIIVNEAGKNAVSLSGFGVNSTMDTTILIFERCIKQGE